jgi:hypothetical protein
MSSLLYTLLSNGTITDVFPGYKCKCSEVVLQRGSIRSHVNTKRHLNWMNDASTKDGTIIDEKDECSICYEIKGKFYKCICCFQVHCVDCHSKIKTCPFCRTNFKNTDNKVKFVVSGRTVTVTEQQRQILRDAVVSHATIPWVTREGTIVYVSKKTYELILRMIRLFTSESHSRRETTVLLNANVSVNLSVEQEHIIHELVTISSLNVCTYKVYHDGRIRTFYLSRESERFIHSLAVSFSN